MRGRSTALLLTLALIGGLTTAYGFTESSSGDPSRLGEAFDSRTALSSIGPSKAQAKAIVALVRTHPDVRLGWNARFGTPSSILRHGGTLTPRASGTPANVARAWLRTNAALFGWRAADAAALRVKKTLSQPNGGARTVLFHQVFGSLEGNSYGGSLTVALDRDNRILSVRANVLHATSLATGALITASKALSIASHRAAPKMLGRKGEWTRFARGAFAAEHWVRKVAFPTGHGRARPAWEVIFVKRLDDGYRTVVDALSGEVLYRYQMVKHEAPEGRVFDTYPGAPLGGKHELRSFAGDPAASPQGWFSIVPGVNTMTTLGNNATTATNWGVYIAPDGPGQVRPVSPTLVFDYPFTDAWAQSECGVNPISESQGAPDTPTYAQDALPAVTNLFYHHNVMHDFFYKLGFVEEAGAMQATNFGKTSPTLENDPLIGLVQAAGVAGDAPRDDPLGRDNAYMFPNPDGVPQWSGMFLFETVPDAFIAPCTDGDFATDVIYHEYAHGVTSRWVGAEFGNLESPHGGSMGESWSDFYAMHYLHKHGLEKSTALAPYVTADPVRGLRNFTLGNNPLTLADFGFDLSGEEVHADGEIWNGTLWDIRTALAKARSNGADLASQLIADAMPISGPLPTMLNMRDAILAADVARTKGANQELLWKVFAGRGMGRSAFAKDATDINPIPGFDHKDPALNGRINGSVVDATSGAAISGARVFLGLFEARTTPIARTGADGFFSVPVQAGTYPVTIQARGHGARTFKVTAAAGGTTEREFRMPFNFASQFAGATIKDSSNPSGLGAPELAIDDTASSTWRTDSDADGPAGESFVVDLAGNSPVTIQDIQVTGYMSPGSGRIRFETLKEYEILTSMDGTNFTSLVKGGFPFTKVRPRAMDVHYKGKRLASPVQAKFVKFVAVAPQSEGLGRVQVGDVQIFGVGPSVRIAAAVAQAAETFHDEGVALVASADALLTKNVMEAMGEAGQCIFPPPTQGIDAWVSELPPTFGDGTHLIDVKVEQPHPVRPDVDVFFESVTCVSTGSVATTAAREVGLIPQASRYVVSQLYTTAVGTITVDAKADTSGAIAQAPAVRGGTTKPPKPKPSGLPATGVAPAVPFGLGLVAASVVMGVVLRRPRGRRART